MPAMGVAATWKSSLGQTDRDPVGCKQAFWEFLVNSLYMRIPQKRKIQFKGLFVFNHITVEAHVLTLSSDGLNRTLNYFLHTKCHGDFFVCDVNE